jgi:2-polyprenyl-3-methyl-5-hydroxy-6-metoxy-1,4-benzoquinol methylase
MLPIDSTAHTDTARLLSPAWADELTHVRRAVDYYERFAQRVGHSELGAKVARYYEIGATSSRAVLRFKALFFATRIEAVLRFIESFQRAHGRRPHMLDVGCGYGLETTLLAAAGAEITGVDYVSTKVEIARTASVLLRELAGLDREITYLQGDIRTYTADTAFDAIYSSATLHHIEPLQTACDAIARLLQPGGSFFLSDENGASPVQQLLVQHRIGWRTPRVLTQVDEATGERSLYGNENIRPVFAWKRHLQTAGLTLRGLKYCRFLPPLDLDVATLLRAERLARRMPLVAQLTAIGFIAEFIRKGSGAGHAAGPQP